MLGGMSGGGMGFIFDPSIKAQAEEQLLALMRRRKDELAASIPFAMDPVLCQNSIAASAGLFQAEFTRPRGSRS